MQRVDTITDHLNFRLKAKFYCICVKIVLSLSLIVLFMIPISVEAENQVFVSEIMFSGTEYLGTVFSEYEGLVTISSSDSSIVKVTSSLYFDGTQKQQMFEITPINDGDVTISAKFGSDEISKNVRVYFPTTSQKTLELILPASSTSVSNIVGYVYLLDFGNTMIASEDVEVLLTSKGAIQHPTKITILKGTTGASFDLTINGSSEITASSNSFEFDTESIQFVPRKISVVIDAPHIVSANSLIYAVASFVENDMHYIPTQLRSATISSSDRDIISVSPVNTINQNETIYFDQDGIALIKLYSHNTGIARIDIHVSGFGSSSTEIFVGPSSIESGTINENGTSSTLIEVEEEEETEKSANTILGWSLPKINSGDLYLFAGSYFSKDTITLDVGQDDIQMSREATEYHPVVGQKSIYITSNGAVHDDVMILGNNEIPSNIGYVKISSSVGDFDFSLSSSDILNPYTEQIEFGNPSYQSYQVNIVPLPVVHGYFQDVALIGILDNDGSIINPHRTGQTTQFTATSNGIDVENSLDSFDFGSSIAVISGGVKSGGIIDVFVSGIGTDSKQIYMSKPDTESHSIRIITPQSTYMEEPFSAYAFVVDSQGVPIRQVTPVASGMCQNIKNEIFMCDGIGTVSYFSEFGTVQNDVDLIYHQFDVQIDMPYKLNVGDTGSASVAVDSDVKITVSSAIPNYVTDSDIMFEPDKTGKFDVIIILEKKGYATKTLDFTVMVSDDMVIEISANDGTNDIAVEVIVDGETKQTPFVIAHERKTVTLEFIESKISDVRNITFNNLMIDDLQVSQAKVTLDALDHFAYDSKIRVVAQYDPKLAVSIDGVQDTTYDLGETVIVSPANDKPVFALLVYEKFDGWISNDVQIESAVDGTAVFEIKRNTVLTSTYHTDYTNAGILVSVILALSMISLQRRNNKFMFMMFVDTILRRNRVDEEDYEYEEYDEVDDSKEYDQGESEKDDQVEDSSEKEEKEEEKVGSKSKEDFKFKKWFFKV